MKIDHVHFYTRNAVKTKDWFIHNVGFKAIGQSINQHTRTEAIALNSVCLVFSSPLNQSSPVAKYLKDRPSGVVDIAFRVNNIQSIIERAKCLDIKVLQPLQTYQSAQGKFKFAQIMGWDCLKHTLIEVVVGKCSYCLPYLSLEPEAVNAQAQNKIDHIDHVVLNVATGFLNPAVAIYQQLFGWKIQQSFNIQTQKSGLLSQALIDDTKKVQFNINEPTSANSQIQEFLDINGGSGIQHIALRSQNLIADVAQMQQKQIGFLTIPQSYYSQLKQEAGLSYPEWLAIAKEQILVESQYSENQISDRHLPSSLLMQIFTQPIFEQPTFFLEFIERRQEAKGFGQGNFQALFEAVEREQTKRI